MNIQLSIGDLNKVASDAMIVGVARVSTARDEKGVILDLTAIGVNGFTDNLITERCNAGEFKGNLGDLLTIYPREDMKTGRVIVVGLGKIEELDAQAIRRATAVAARHAQQTGARTISLAINWTSDSFSPAQAVQAQVEGALLGLYTFRIYQQREDDGGVTQVQVFMETFEEDEEDTAGASQAIEARKAEFEQALSKGQALAEATNFARSLVNEPPAVLTPTELAQRASAMAQEVGIECEIFDKARISELGMGGLLGVAQGSAEPPRFIILRYRGAPESDRAMALVGKGITFDTGGISLKPADHMDEMKGDMGGAAAVIGAMQAIARLKPHLNVTALVPTCENMPSGTAYRPGDILRIMNGKTIEIVNTDAEGRLVLADALSYATKEGLSPIIDLATLTGGVVVALGTTMTGLFCNDEQLTSEIINAGRAAGEKYWPMPLDNEYNEYIKSDIADIKQTGGRAASSVTAAKILEHFVGDAQWAHLDIAGTSYVDSQKPYQEKGGTGTGVRTLAELALLLAQKKS